MKGKLHQLWHVRTHTHRDFFVHHTPSSASFQQLLTTPKLPPSPPPACLTARFHFREKHTCLLFFHSCLHSLSLSPSLSTLDIICLLFCRGSPAEAARNGTTPGAPAREQKHKAKQHCHCACLRMSSSCVIGGSALPPTKRNLSSGPASGSSRLSPCFGFDVMRSRLRRPCLCLGRTAISQPRTDLGVVLQCCCLPCQSSISGLLVGPQPKNFEGQRKQPVAAKKNNPRQPQARPRLPLHCKSTSCKNTYEKVWRCAEWRQFRVVLPCNPQSRT